MPQQNIFLGTVPNDGTGTKPRPAGQVINENFTEVYTDLSTQGSRLAALETFRSTATGSVARPLVSKLSDTVNVQDLGADPLGSADSTAAFRAAFATGKPVVANGTFKITDTIAFRAHRQWLIGYGCNLVPTGNFDLFTVSSLYEGCGVVGARVEATGMTGGHIVSGNQVERFTLRDMLVWSPWRFALWQRFNFVSYENVWVNNIRGDYGTTAYGDNTTGKSDILRMSGVTHAGSAANKPHGIIVNGGVHTVQLHQVALVNVNRGLWVTNLANSGIVPQFVIADDLEVDFSTNESVRLEVGGHYYFTNPYFHGSSAASGLYVSDAVVADSVIVHGGKITSHARHGVENLTRIRILNSYMSGNALGDFSSPNSALIRSPRLEVDGAFFSFLNGGNPAVVFDATDYLTYNRTDNRLSFLVGNTAVVSADATRAAFTVPVQFPGYTVAFLPAASAVAGMTVRVTDKQNRLATSDGTVWRFMDGSDVATGAGGSTGGGGTGGFVPGDYRAVVEEWNGSRDPQTFAFISMDYTVAVGDNNKVKVIAEHPSDTTVDIKVFLPNLPVGTTIRFIQGGANKLAFQTAPGAGQGVNAYANQKRSGGQHATVIATVLFANYWMISGQLVT